MMVFPMVLFCGVIHTSRGMGVPKGLGLVVSG